MRFTSSRCRHRRPQDCLFPGLADFVNRRVCFPSSQAQNLDEGDCKFQGGVDLISTRPMTSGARWLAAVLPAEPQGRDAVRVGFERSRPRQSNSLARHDLPARVRPELAASHQCFLWLETCELGWADWHLAKFRLKAQRCAGNSPTATIAPRLKGVIPEWSPSRVGLVTNRLRKTSRNALRNPRKPTVFKRNSAGWFTAQTQRDPNKL